MPRICLDTQILAWAMRGPRDAREEALREKSLYLIHELEAQRADIIIPAVAVAEFLGLMPSSQRLPLVAALESTFQVIPFDPMAAFEFTRLPLTGDSREKNKSDRMILATALAAKADVVYSEDQDLHDIGHSFIEVRRLPSIPPRQLSLVEPS